MPFSVHSAAYAELRRRLVAAREEQGLTQTSLAVAIGRNQSFVSKYESGERRLDVLDFALICKALHVDAKVLLARALEHR